MSALATEEMSAVETRQTPSVETGQMSAVETGQMSACPLDSNRATCQKGIIGLSGKINCRAFSNIIG